MTVTVEGQAELTAKILSLVAKAKGRQVEAALRAGALVIQNQAKINAPVRTGTLRRNITHEVDGSHDTGYARIGTNIEYAPHVEFGTSKRPPNPFLRNAYDSRIGDAKAEIVAALEKMVTP